MTKQEYDQLPSDGRVACPKCGFTATVPYPGCHCPPNKNGYGTTHINAYHHDCRYPVQRILESAPQWVKDLIEREKKRWQARCSIALD